MQTLHEALAVQRDRVLQRWLSDVRGSLHPESMPRLELLDHLPIFLDEVIAALRDEIDSSESKVGEVHGGQRLSLGFSVDAVIREYGAMQTCIFAVAREVGVAITPRDYQVVLDCVNNGIASAVSEYSRQRDAEMHRQATEHFAFVAHELRNPLSSALLALDSLQQRRVLDPADRTVMALDRGLRAMRDLIDHSLRLARVGAGVDLRAEPIQLRSLLEEAETAVAVDAEAKGIKLQLSVEGDDKIEVDVRLVRSALSNLVRNAVKFTHASGTVLVRGRIDSGRATIEVEDACGGLRPGDAEKAFSPFVQLGDDKTGFGLGLAIARQAVDAHGGTLRIQNLPDKGCIFVLELPTAPVPRDALGRSAP